jgi:hypothetical protein
VTVLTFTGPVAVPEQYAFDLGRLHIGYAVANFGAVLLSSQETISTDQSYLTDGWAGAQWFASSGGVAALGAVIGEATDTAAPQTVTLTGGAAAGDYLLIGCAVATAPFGPWPIVAADIAITDSQGAGTIDTSGFDQWAFGGNAPDANGWNIVIAWGFNAYHLAAPLGAGDTVTIAFPNTPTAYITTRIHVLQHVRSPVPLGQDPPGPFVGWSFLAQFLPKTSNFFPIIKWIGTGLLTGRAIPVNNNVPVPGSLVSFDLNIARGVAVHRPNGALTPGDHLIQMPTGDIVLVPGCRVVVDTMNADGSPRSTDSFSNVQIAITDVGALEQIE